MTISSTTCSMRRQFYQIDISVVTLESDRQNNVANPSKTALVGWPNVGPTSILSSRRWSNVGPTYICYENYQSISSSSAVVLLCAATADEHKLLRAAQARGMMQGDYLFITLYHIPPSTIATPWINPEDTELTQAYMAVKQVGCLNTLRPRQNGRHFPDDSFKWIF